MGTAIGTKFAPAFAPISMANLEKCFLETCAYALRRICDSDYFFKIRVEQLKGLLIKTGYKEVLLTARLVFNLDRSSVFEDGKKRGLKKDYVDRMVLTLDFHPALFTINTSRIL